MPAKVAKAIPLVILLLPLAIAMFALVIIFWDQL